MGIPDFVDGYHLPPGEHFCSLDEVEERLAGGSPARTRAWAYFRQLLDRLHDLGICPSVILIDGSFVTGRSVPKDVDAVLLVEPEVLDRAWAAADEHDRAALYLMVNFHEVTRAVMGTHAIIAREPSQLALWSSFFRRGGPNGLRQPDAARDPSWVTRPEEKGILRVEFPRGGMPSEHD